MDRGVWTAKTVKRPHNIQHNPQYANYWAPLTRKRHIPPHSAQPRHTNYWAPRMRKRHRQEHRPQRPTERSDPTQHAKGRTGDCPGPRKGATTRRNVTRGGRALPGRRARAGLYRLLRGDRDVRAGVCLTASAPPSLPTHRRPSPQLIAAGAKVSTGDNIPAIVLAGKHRHVEVVDVLISAGQREGASFHKALLSAIVDDCAVVVERLLHWGVCACAGPEGGDMPLRLAIHQDNAGIVGLLLHAGANLDAERFHQVLRGGLCPALLYPPPPIPGGSTGGGGPSVPDDTISSGVTPPLNPSTPIQVGLSGGGGGHFQCYNCELRIG